VFGRRVGLCHCTNSRGPNELRRDATVTSRRKGTCVRILALVELIRCRHNLSLVTLLILYLVYYLLLRAKVRYDTICSREAGMGFGFWDDMDDCATMMLDRCFETWICCSVIGWSMVGEEGYLLKH